MSPTPKKGRGASGKKVRVAFRRNRSKPARIKDWTTQARGTEDNELDTLRSESVVAKGDLSRHRTVIVADGDGAIDPGLRTGTVVAMRGLYADVDDGDRVLSCPIRRVLRTRRIKERHPVTVGDHVWFSLGDYRAGVVTEGVIAKVADRRGVLQRRSGKRVHTIVANVERALIVASAADDPPKPHLIDRYIVAALAGGIKPVICMNKADLDEDGRGALLLERYVEIGYPTLLTSVVDGRGIDDLRALLRGGATVIAGQSGVGKSALLNVVQPGLNLRIGDIIEQSGKGRHTTTTARLIHLEIGGYVVDTPGIRTLDLSPIGRYEFELYFVEFLPHVPHCKFRDCGHTHETGCHVKAAVEAGDIHPERYESYVRMMEETRD